MSELALEAPAAAAHQPEPFLPALRRDLFRHFVYHPGAGFAKKLSICLMVEGVWAAFVYRFGRALRTGALPGLLGLSWLVYRTLEIAVRILTGIHLDVDAHIAPGFYVGHHGAIFVGAGSRIGANSSIGQMCYVGAAGPEAPGGAPVIGERVYLGPGSKVLGGVRIGDRAAVGASAVVLEDVPSRAVVVGNPSRVVSNKGSDENIYLGEGEKPLTGMFAQEAQRK